MVRRFCACILIVALCPGFVCAQTSDPQSKPSLEKQDQVPNSPSATTPDRTEPKTQTVPTPSTVKASTALPGSLLLEDGTPVKLRIAQTVSSADAHVGQQVDFEVLEEVRLSAVLIVPKGGIAWATVTEAQSKRRLGRGGKLNMNIDAVRLLDGQKAALRAVKDAKGGGHVGAMTGAMVATAIVFFPAAPLFLFMHGKDITIPKGTEVTAFINGDIHLETAKFLPAAAPVVATNAGPAADVSAASIDVASTPNGADIELDGSFVGSTPSTLNVAPGEHSISIKKSGYKPWERKVKILSGQVRISADLEAQQGAGLTH